MDKPKKIRSKPYAKGTFICRGCASQKGLRWPLLGSVEDKECKCEICKSYLTCYEREDLLGPMDVDVYEQ